MDASSIIVANLIPFSKGVVTNITFFKTGFRVQDHLLKIKELTYGLTRRFFALVVPFYVFGFPWVAQIVKLPNIDRLATSFLKGVVP